MFSKIFTLVYMGGFTDLFNIIIEAAVALFVLWIFAFAILPAMMEATGQSQPIFMLIVIIAIIVVIVAVITKFKEAIL